MFGGAERTVWAILIEGHPKHIPVKLFQTPSTGLEVV